MITSLSFNSPYLVTANGGYGDTLVSQLEARYQAAAKNNALFRATRASATIPVVANNMVSVFFLYNPVGSGIVMALLDVQIHQILATTVVNTYGLYSGTTAETAAGTFTTPGTVYNSRINGAVGSGAYYSAYTHSGTPTLRAIIGSHGAVTNATASQPIKNFDGALILPAGQGVSVAATTAASTSSGVAIDAAWLEFAGT